VPAPPIVGFCWLEVKPLGPVHEYVAPATVEEKSCNVLPAQIGPLLDAEGVAGTALTVMRLFPVACCASGFVMVTFFAPVVAEEALRLSVTCVGSVKVTLLTVGAVPPASDAAMWFR
jgi:hypothetical protein